MPGKRRRIRGDFSKALLRKVAAEGRLAPMQEEKGPDKVKQCGETVVIDGATRLCDGQSCFWVKRFRAKPASLNVTRYQRLPGEQKGDFEGYRVGKSTESSRSERALEDEENPKKLGASMSSRERLNP